MEKKKKFNYKGVKINEEELAITKIGEMPNENKSPIFLIFIFGILMIFVFFLPNIVSYFEKDDSTIINNPTADTGKDSSSSEEENKIVYYDLNESLEIDLDNGIKVNNFKIVNNIISFKITNSSDSRYYFDQKNYFLELYTSENTLLERVILSKESVAKDNSKDYSYSILNATSINAKKVVFVEKMIEDYPNITLNKNEVGEEVLVCDKDYENITYTFKDEKLTRITDAVNYVRTGSELDYQNNLNLWQSRVNTYNTISGITSSFMISDNSFMVNTVLDLSNVKISSVDNSNYYAYETLGKVVNFEMEARGFSCN